MTRLEIYKELTKQIGGTKKPFMALGFLKLWALVFGLRSTALYLRLVDNVVIRRNTNELWLIVGGYILIYIFLTVGIVLSKKFTNMLILKFDIKIKHILLKKYALIQTLTINTA